VVFDLPRETIAATNVSAEYTAIDLDASPSQQQKRERKRRKE